MSDRSRNLLSLFAAIGIPLIVGGLSAVPTISAVPTWYRPLKKPPWTPPDWVFGPVWNILYATMGTAMWLVWKLGPNRPQVREATGLFAAQLGLNALWSLIFFGLRAPAAALAELIALWAVLAATVERFYRLRPAAGLLLVPYLMWVTFAGTLNAGVWWLNRR